MWVTLADYQGHEINDLGVVRKISTGNELRTSINQTGVRYVALRNTTLGKYENRAVGTLVAETFCSGQSANEGTVLHLDGDIENNRVDNLMWTTRWHAMAYHQQIKEREYTRRCNILDTTSGEKYYSLSEAAMATGCLPVAIGYGMRYNDSLANDEHANFVNPTYPGRHVFRSF
jgi:hypothetical protein